MACAGFRPSEARRSDLLARLLRGRHPTRTAPRAFTGSPRGAPATLPAPACGLLLDDDQALPTRLDEMIGDWIEGVRSLLEAPAPAVLTTYRKDGSAQPSPVWFRWSDGGFEVVIAHGDLKLRHLARDPRCVLVVFESVRPFRGVEARGVGELVECDVSSARAAIASRYLGASDGARFAAARRSKPGVVLRLAAASPRVWDLSGILPA